jgi:hypothetical protein
LHLNTLSSPLFAPAGLTLAFGGQRSASGPSKPSRQFLDLPFLVDLSTLDCDFV